MKKIPIFLAAMMTCSLLNNLAPLSAKALYVDENQITWWSVEELLDFSKTAESEEKELCGDDLNCREELFFTRIESEDMRYQALEMLKEGRFWVTKVNPTEETLEVLYFDEDEMMKRWGIEEIQPLEFIFLAWFDNINGQIGNYNHFLPIEPQCSDDLHLMYADSSDSFSFAGFPATSSFDLPINQTGLINNSLGRIYIATFGENYNSKGYLDYSDCLKDYREGETCQLMFSPGYGYRYLSPRNNSLENEQNGGNEENKDDDVIVSPDEKEEEASLQNEEVNTNKVSVQQTTKAPNTGVNTKTCEKVIEFPWWLGVLIVIGNLACLWLFFPRKSRKKY